MIIIVHGDDSAKSRAQAINHFKKQALGTKFELKLEDSTPDILYELTHKKDLFGGYTSVILDITGSKSPDFEGYQKILESVPTENTLIIFSSKDLPKNHFVIKMAQKEKIKVFENNPIPSGNIFKFIDSLFNKDRVGTYKELTSLAKDDVDNFYIFSMILYGLRNLIHADIKSVKFQQMQSFQQTKLSQQTKKFGESKLKNLLEELYLLDKRVKTGEIDADLMITIAIEKVLC